MARGLDRALSILNGALGQHLARTRNPLATEMALFDAGAALPLERAALSRAHPAASARAVVLVHGLMGNERDWRFSDGSDYGQRLATDLHLTPLYVRYNSGLAIAESGAQLSQLLERLVEVYPRPLEELILVGHSMGGLVIRSACHAASLAQAGWLPLVKRAFYVATPHLGAPLERVGRVVTRVLSAIDDPYTRLIAQVAELRSDGIKDLGDGLRDARHPVPLLPQIAHYLIAGSLVEDPYLAALFGDAMVSVRSATAGALADRTLVVPGVGHTTLARHPAVYAQLRTWLAQAP